MSDTYDFYKGNMFTNYPLVNGKLSIKCYFEGLLNCYLLYRTKFLRKCSSNTEINKKSI